MSNGLRAAQGFQIPVQMPDGECYSSSSDTGQNTGTENTVEDLLSSGWY